jgi:excisionase family DNA binding protein
MQIYDIRQGAAEQAPSRAAQSSSRRLIDSKEVGSLLGCSWRTVYRLADAGKIPQGIKLGALRRWDTAEIESFIAGGCKPPKSTTKGVRS